MAQVGIEAEVGIEVGIVPLRLLGLGQVRKDTGKGQALTRCQAQIEDLETQIAALMSQKAEYQAVKRLVQETPADVLELLQTILCEQRSLTFPYRNGSK